jgi:hypothetical protein
MPTSVELGYDPDILSAFEAAPAELSLSPQTVLDADVRLYQEIADRRAQTEDAEVLRRARSL